MFLRIDKLLKKQVRQVGKIEILSSHSNNTRDAEGDFSL